MTEPINFSDQTPRLSLPNLFAAQAQKEITVNEAFARLDMLLHACVEGEADAPPAAPSEGECWMVGASPTGNWAANAGDIASWQAGNWLFATPTTGMLIFDKAAGSTARFDGSWQYAAGVPAPTGGATEDVEARAAIGGLIAALVAAGILGPI